MNMVFNGFFVCLGMWLFGSMLFEHRGQQEEMPLEASEKPLEGVTGHGS